MDTGRRLTPLIALAHSFFVCWPLLAASVSAWIFPISSRTAETSSAPLLLSSDLALLVKLLLSPSGRVPV
jgi:hypothetical protein